uniref:Uncharacterized protein n=2 Tax=viral metagenome TaxID=1070528 RepID=A0A6C0KHC7_9ZZZZ
MKLLKAIWKKFLPKDLPKPVGRWNIEQCNKKTNYKIDLSNEDHCGPCGQYALTKLDLKPKITKE